MCVIVYKPKDTKMPDYETLKNCFENNGDGAGYMFAHGGRVHIVKGLMTLEDFIKSLVSTVTKYGQDIAYVLHFRISTQAGVRKDGTQPFPLSKSMNELRKLKTSCNFGVAHNGIIYLTSSVKKDVTYSDTMEFITDYLSLIIRDRDYYKDADTLTLIERLSESRLAILDGGGHCELTGEGWILDDGIYYSNDGYLPARMLYRDFFLFDGENYYCPVCEDGDDSWCAACVNYDYCYFGVGPEAAETVEIAGAEDKKLKLLDSYGGRRV